MTDRELFEKALDALEQHSAIQHPQQRHYRDAAIAALRERLAQPEQEPVAFVDPIWIQRPDLIIEQRLEIKKLFARVRVMDYVPLYTAPQPAPTIDKSAAIRIATALGWEPPREKQEQEPVAKWDASAPLVVHPHPAFQATQQRREWVELTDEEKKDALVSVDPETRRLPPGFRDFASAIEAKLKEKNNG